MKKMKMKVSLLTVCLLISSTSLFALTGTEIAQNAHDVESADTVHSVVQMDLISKDGSVDSRIIEEWSMEKDELKSIVMAFHKPASVANTRFLQIENESRADDKWIYLPALKRVRRIASSDGDKSFMGTDMTYDDMDSREVEQDSHEMMGEEKIGSWDCYKVKGSAVDPADSQYSYRITWFDKDTFVPVKVEMYDKKEVLLKVMEVKDLQKVDNYWTPMDVMLKNVQTNHATQIKMLKIVHDQAINPRLFTTNFLEKGK
ncbi:MULTISPECIES: outer membrane lipoprotein-sorting protein [unclassified Oceanispirochaeta]|uniref:outer membrane lipoprotein-sorting protein n=1 Tax=unclassified Oceanispirochaeta TaxID=2635722 RepID=UPI001E30CF00|nr:MULTISPECIES: outer membrane lipoprotein-sorting protein [unclassified Oceanispirochaeta]